MRVNRSIGLAAAGVALAAIAAACGGTPSAGSSAGPTAAEQNPAGDIPTTRLVDFTAPSGVFTMKVPEG